MNWMSEMISVALAKIHQTSKKFKLKIMIKFRTTIINFLKKDKKINETNYKKVRIIAIS